MWSDIPGWSKDILPFYNFISPKLLHGETFVEVGVFLGRSLAYMGTLRPDLELWAIDPWLSHPSRGFDGFGEFATDVERHGTLWNAFLVNMTVNAPDVLERTHIIRTNSTVGLKLPVAADMVFIDGAHDYTSVVADIVNAREMLTPGGILAGHDYGHPSCPDVAKAVDILLPHRKLEETCWWVQV